MEKVFKRRVKFSFFVLTLGAFILLTKLFSLQILEKGRLHQMGLLNHKVQQTVCFERGKIMDRNMHILATNIESFSICAFPRKIKDSYTLAKSLSNILCIPQYTLLEKMRKDSSFVWICRKSSLPPYKIKEIENLEGIGLIKEYRRVYPKGKVCAHVLGFAGVDNRGLEGVELQFDKYLYRKPKFVTLLKDAKNSLIYRETLPHLYAYNVVLTMDEMLQYIAEKRLKEWCKRFSAKSGCVILMDPYTAQILAMAVYPEFDPNHFFQHSPSQWRNRAITDLFEPGSIFKIITMAVALKEGIDPYKKQFFCNGFMEVEGRRIKCHQKHGAISVEDAIKYSCNCGVIQMVAHINDEKFYKHIKEFGFGQFTGIQLPGEVRGILKHPRSWTKTSKSSISIGYEISCTPLQMLCALLPFANGGYLLRPLIVKKIVDEKGRCIKEFSPTVIRRALEEKIVEDARRILEKVVEEGTGKGASLLFCAVAGKTGTAKKVEDGEYKEKFIASFVGFFPSKEAKVAMLALINEPKRLYWGGKVAAPLFKKIAEDVSLYLRIKQPLQIAKDANKVSLLH